MVDSARSLVSGNGADGQGGVRRLIRWKVSGCSYKEIK